MSGTALEGSQVGTSQSFLCLGDMVTFLMPNVFYFPVILFYTCAESQPLFCCSGFLLCELSELLRESQSQSQSLHLDSIAQEPRLVYAITEGFSPHHKHYQRAFGLLTERTVAELQPSHIWGHFSGS